MRSFKRSSTLCINVDYDSDNDDKFECEFTINSKITWYCNIYRSFFRYWGLSLSKSDVVGDSLLYRK